MNRAARKEIEACAQKAGVVIQSIEHHSRHYKVLVKGAKPGVVFVSVSPSDSWRVYRNVTADMRKAGYGQ